MSIFSLFLGKPGSRMSAKERRVSDAINKLNTLEVVDGRISIDPSEVVTERFETERKKARRLLSA